MAPRTILAQLVVALKDDASKGAKALAGNLKDLEKSAVDFAKTMQGAKWGSAFTRDLGKLKATQEEIDKIKRSWGDLQNQLAGTKNATMRRDAARQWANDWRTNLQAVRIAQAQLSDEAVRNTKRQLAEEKKAFAAAERDKLRVAKETAREKDKLAREASSAERASARETARVAREAARQQAAAAREAARASRLAERDARRSERENGRGAGSIGRSVVRNLSYAAGAGAGTYMSGRALRGTARAGGEALREDARDYLAGLTPEESKRIAGMAQEQSGNYKSLTSTSLHNLYRETSMTALNMEGTAAVAPDLAKGMVILQSLKGKEEALAQLTGFMRGLDTLGKNVNPADVRSLIDGMTRAAGVQGVEYNPKQIFTMAKQSRSAGGALSNEFLNTIAPSLIADMGPAAPGTALATMMSSVVGGTMSGGNTKEKLKLQREYGLREANNRMTPDDRDMMTKNPHLYAWNRLMPALEKQGVDTKNEGAVAEALNRLYTRTVSDLFGKLISQKEQYQLTQGKLAKAPGLDGAAGVESKDPFVALAGVTSQIVNTAAEISKPIIEVIMPALNGLAGVLNSVSNSIKENPVTAKALGIAGAGAGAAAVGGAAWLGSRWASKTFGFGQWGPGGGAALGEGAAAGSRFLPLLARGAGLGGLAYGGYGAATTGAEVLGGIGSTAAGSNYTPRDAEGIFDLATQIRDLNAQIAGIKERTHPSRAGEPNVDVDRLEGQTQELRNRIAAGTQNMGGEIVQSLANGIAEGSTTAAAAMDTLMETLRAKARAGITIPMSVTQASPGSPAVPARASGGSVSAGGLYRVNEYGEEFFQPTEDGRIIDPRRTAAGGGGAGPRTASLSMSNTFQISGGDAQSTADSVIAEIDRRVREMARTAFADYGVELA
ncbi:MAG: hypothetical protein O9972_13050 [Burkholderiales bacterium]|nr:hypothetical protein [Burkholderiales bacterium]